MLTQTLLEDLTRDPRVVILEEVMEAIEDCRDITCRLIIPTTGFIGWCKGLSEPKQKSVNKTNKYFKIISWNSQSFYWQIEFLYDYSSGLTTTRIKKIFIAANGNSICLSDETFNWKDEKTHNQIFNILHILNKKIYPH